MKMIVENFKGITKQEVEFKTVSELIGLNESGKTTLIHAFFWGMDGKDYNENQNKDVRNIHTPETDPRVTIIYPEISFRRTFKQTKAGGNTTVYEINRGLSWETINLTDSKIKGENVKGYETHVMEKFPQLRICADIFYLAEKMDTQEARKLVLENGGNVEPEEVLENVPIQSREILETLFKTYGANEAYRLLKKRQTEIKDEKKKLQGKIEGKQEEIEKNKPEGSKEYLEKQTQNIGKGIEELEEELKKIGVGDDLYKAVSIAEDEKRRAKVVIDEQNRKAETEHENECNRLENQYKEAVRKADAEYFEEKRKWENKVKELKEKLGKKNDLESIQQRKQIQIQRIKEEKEQVYIPNDFKEMPFIPKEYTPEVSEAYNCENCGSPLIKTLRKIFDKAEEERKEDHYKAQHQLRAVHDENEEKARLRFEKAQKERVEELNRKLEEINKELAGFNSTDFEEIEAELKKLEEEKPEQQNIIKSEMPEKPKKIEFLSDSYDRAIQTAQQKINDAKAGLEERQAPVKEKIRQKKALLDETNKQLGQYRTIESLEKGIRECQEERKELTREENENAKKLDALNDYNHALSNIVRGKTREIFGAEIDLFRVQVNGELKEDFVVLCDTKNGPIPFRTANNASRIKTGIKIVEKCQDLFDSRPPVFVDNIESVTDALPEVSMNMVFCRAGGTSKLEIKHYQNVAEFNEK